MLQRALILLVITVVATIPSWTRPEWDGDEARCVRIASGMLEHGEWIVPPLDRTPWGEPPLHYWLLSAPLRWFGDSVVAMRLLSVLFGLAAALVAGEVLRRQFGPGVGWIGALGIACSPLVVFEWPSAAIDPIFASLTAMSLWCLAGGVAGDRVGQVLTSGALAGLALLHKGPAFFLFAIGAYLVWWRHRGGRHTLAHFVPMLLLPLLYHGSVLLFGNAPAAAPAAANGALTWLGPLTWDRVWSTPTFWVCAFAIQLPLILWCFWEWRGARDARMDAGDFMLRVCSGSSVIAVLLLTFADDRSIRDLSPNVLLFTFAVAPAVAHFARFGGAVPVFARCLLGGVGMLAAIGLLVLPFVPVLGANSIGFALLAALVPLFVRTPRHVVFACLVLPVAAAWTIGLDRARHRAESPDAGSAVGAMLERELVLLGVDDDLATQGDFDPGLLRALRRRVAGDEAMRGAPTARWLLREPSAVGPSLPGYVPRVHLDLGARSFCISERVDGKR